MDELDSRQAIFEAAKELFYRDGYTATTMRKIAQAAKTSVGLPLYYFGSKENLGVEIYKEIRGKLGWICQQLHPVSDRPERCRHLSVLADEALLVENATYRELYVKVANSPEMARFISSLVGDSHSQDAVLRKHRYLNSLTVSAVKANLVNADLEKYQISQEELIEFTFHRYLRLQEPEYANQAEFLFRRCLAEYRGLRLRIGERFDLGYDAGYLKAQREAGSSSR